MYRVCIDAYVVCCKKDSEVLALYMYMFIYKCIQKCTVYNTHCVYTRCVEKKDYEVKAHIHVYVHVYTEMYGV